MRYLLIVLAALSLPVHYLFGQTYLYETGQVRLDRYMEQESTLGSSPLDLRGTYVGVRFGLSDLEQPTGYVRRNTDFRPEPVIKYFFSAPDSTVRQIKIDIDQTSEFYEDYEIYNKKPLLSRLEEYNGQYDLIRGELISRFGAPQVTQALFLYQEEVNLQPYWKRSDEWDNDTVMIDMYLVYADDSSHTGTYRVRASIAYKDPDLDKKQAELAEQFGNTVKWMRQCDSVAQLSLSLIFKGDYEASWQLLSDEAQKEITYEGFVKTASALKELSKDHGEELSPASSNAVGAMEAILNFNEGLEEESAN